MVFAIFYVPPFFQGAVQTFVIQVQVLGLNCQRVGCSIRYFTDADLDFGVMILGPLLDIKSLEGLFPAACGVDYSRERVHSGENMSSNKGMRTKTYTQITSLHSSNTPSACGGDPLFV